MSATAPTAQRSRLTAKRPLGAALFTLSVGCATLLTLSVGCATAGMDGPPVPTPVEAGSLEDQIEAAARAASEGPTQTVRYNPVKCTCPPFEVQLGLRWVRVELESADDPESLASRLTLRAKEELDNDPPPVYVVTGDLTTSARRCGSGTLYLVLGVDLLN